MIDLRAFIGSTGDIDLGTGTYAVYGQPVVIGAGRQISAEGAFIWHYPTNDRWCPCLILRGTGTALRGTAYVNGPAPMGSPYYPDLEAQHGVEIQGATNVTIESWQFRNTYGDGIYVGKSHDLTDWTHGLTLNGTRTKENGRCGLSLVAVDGLDAGNLEMQRTNLSVIDIEPPGSNWGALNISIHDITVKDHGGGFVIASKGQGRSDTMRYWKFSNILCPNRNFNAIIVPPDVLRRSNIEFRNCSGGEFANGSPIRLTRCDNVIVANITQAHTGDLVSQTDCTNVQIA
jgi:hypothetical protein